MIAPPAPTRPMRAALTVLASLAALVLPPSAAAQTGLRSTTTLAFRATPLGINAISDVGYRVALFDGASPLLENTYVEAGASFGFSPAYLWAGGYVEAVPLAILPLRFSAQYANYFGTLGHLWLPRDDQPDWSYSAIDALRDTNDGVASSGLMLQAVANPRVLLPSGVAVSLETTWNHFRMDVDDRWYEPFFDVLLEPTDSFWTFRPTAGYMFRGDDGANRVLLAARWEHRTTVRSDVSYDLLGLVGVWFLPDDLIGFGESRWSALAGTYLYHPSRGTVPWFGTAFTMSFGPRAR